MLLVSARTAMRQADEAFAELSSVAAATTNDELFRDRFVSCIGMIGRVGSIIDEETKGHRTPAFGGWWQSTGRDPLFSFVRDVRNAEFKRGEERKAAEHQVHVEDAVGVTESAHVAVIENGQVIEERSHADVPTPAPTTPDPEHTIVWRFAGGSHNGTEVLALLRQYLDWVRGTLLPEAERLTTQA